MNDEHDDPYFRQLEEEERAFLHPDEWGLDLRPVFKLVLNPPPTPDKLSDAEVMLYLRCMVDLLARHHVCLVATNHLGNRELYRLIMEQILPHPVGVGPNPAGGILYHECCSFESEEWFSYYARDCDREEWRALSGETPPPRRPLVSDRDTWIELLAEAYRDQPLPVFSDDDLQGPH